MEKLEEPGELDTIAGIARRFQISKETVRRRIRANEWPVYVLGERSFRLDINEIKALIKREKV